MMRTSSMIRAGLGLAASLALVPHAHGQTFTWTGTANGNWSNAANWSPGVPTPGNTTDLVFNSFLDSSYTANNDIGSPFVLRSMTFNNEAFNGAIASYVQIGGGPIQFSGTGAGINVIGPGDQFIGAFSATPTTLELTGVTTISGNSTSGLLRIQDQIIGAGSLVINKPSTNFGNNAGGVNLFFTSTSAVNTYSGGTILQAGTLVIGGGIQAGTTSTAGNLGTGTLRISTTGTGLDATGELRGQSGSPTIVLNPVTIDAGATLNEKRGTLIVFGQGVSGSGAGAGVSVGVPVIAYSTNTGYAFEGASNYTGRTDIINSNIILRGTNGALTGSTQIELFRNGVLGLDSNTINPDTGNTAGNHTSQDRIRDDAVVTMHRATLNLTGGGGTSTTETIGTLNADGWNNYHITQQVTNNTVLTINNLNRINRGTFEFRNPALGASPVGTVNTANVVLGQLNGASPTSSLLGGGGAGGSTNISILPFMTGATSANTGGTTFLTYDANGLRMLNTSTEFATALQAVSYLPGGTNNVRSTTPLVALSPQVNANSLLFAGANTGLYGAGGFTGRVNVGSGVIQTVFSSGANFLNVAELNFGGREAIITGNNVGVINSAITNNTGLTYSGTATRTALVSPNNVINGPVTLNGGEAGFPGALMISSQANLGGATSLNFQGGVLNFANLGTGTADTLSTPINIGPAGGTINVMPIGMGVATTAQVLNLTGPITGTGPLHFNTGASGTAGGGGTVILNGDATGFSGPVLITGVVRFDSDARLGTGTVIGIGNSNLNQPGELHATATTSTNKNVYMLGTTFVRVDPGQTYTMNGYITSLGSAGFRKFGAGELVLTGENTYQGATFVGSQAIPGTIFAPTAFAAVGGTLTLRDQGALLYTSSYTLAPGSTLVADNTGTTNLSNRLNNSTVNLAGGSLVLRGSATAASTETLGVMNLVTNSGSTIEVVPGAAQTASLFFSGPTNGGLVRNVGATVTLRAPNLGGTGAGSGQINFIHNASPSTGPALTNGILPGVYGEDSATNAVGLTTVDTVAPGGGVPQHYRSRLLTAGEYTLNAFPDAGTVTTNHRQTAAANPAGSPTVNSLFLDSGGALNIGGSNTVTFTSGTVLMAGGTAINGGTVSAPTNTDLSVYVGPGTATLGSSINLATTGRTFAKTGPGTLDITAPSNGTTPAGTYSIQRGTVRLGSGGSVPIGTSVIVDAGANFDINGTGSPVEIARLSGLGDVQLGSTAGTVLRVNTPSGSNLLYGGTISGTGSFEKTGPGTFAFVAGYNYTGPITYSAGFLQFGEGSSFSPVIPVVSGGTITMADTTDLSVSNVQEFQRPIVVNVGATIGQAILDNFTTFGNTHFSGPITVGNLKTLRINTASAGLMRFTGAIDGPGNITWGSTGHAIVEGNNTYTGTTTFGTAGVTVGVGSNSAFGNGGTVLMSFAPNLYAFGPNRTIANPVSLNADITYGTPLPVYQGFDLAFTGPTTLSANRTITTTAAGRLTLTNVGGGAFNLTKAGGGTLGLAGANNSYSGTTAVNAGTLLVNGTLTTGGGAVSVGGGAVLGGSGTINRPVSLSALAAVSPGNSPGELTVGGNVALAANSIYLWELGANTTAGAGVNWDQLTLTSGDLSVASGARLVLSFVGTATLPNFGDAFWTVPERWSNIVDLVGTATNSSGATAFSIDNSAWSQFGTFSTEVALSGGGIDLQWTPVAVPEPATLLALGGVALTGGFVYCWRRRRRNELEQRLA